jgi:predicted 3-demethylubiquinone-9 3-methyltransferase (glyoxalase superfamily)
MPAIVPNLWFDTEALEAAEFYVSVFPNSRVTRVSHYGPDMPGPAGGVFLVDFELDGTRFTAINGGPAPFAFDESISFVIDTPDQGMLDHYWDALTADGGEEGPCGWLKDRYGVSWQVVPVALMEEMQTDPDRMARAMQAIMPMKRLDLATIRAAAYPGTA